MKNTTPNFRITLLIILALVIITILSAPSYASTSTPGDLHAAKIAMTCLVTGSLSGVHDNELAVYRQRLKGLVTHSFIANTHGYFTGFLTAMGHANAKKFGSFKAAQHHAAAFLYKTYNCIPWQII